MYMLYFIKSFFGKKKNLNYPSSYLRKDIEKVEKQI